MRIPMDNAKDKGKIRLYDKTFKPFIAYDEIEKAIDRVAECQCGFQGQRRRPRPAVRAERVDPVHGGVAQKAGFRL